MDAAVLRVDSHQSAFSVRLNGMNVEAPEWKARYWVYAAVPGLVAYAFEAAQIYAFEATRAPNVGLAAQLVALLMFFMAFIFVPRAVWAIARSENSPAGRGIRLGIAGLVMSVAHLLMLAFILRVLHSPPGWGATHLLHSLMETWLGNAGIWLLVYAGCCGVILTVFSQRRQKPKRILIHQGNRQVPLDVHEILWLEAAGNYVDLHCRGGQYVIRRTLADLERELGPAGFIRSHRKALVNAEAVRAIRSRSGESPVVELDEGQTAPLSRRRLTEFRKLVMMPLTGAREPSAPPL